MQRKWQILSVAILLAAFLVAYLVPIALASPGRDANAEAEVQIHAVLDSQLLAWNRGDIPGYMNGYWNSNEVEFIGSGGIIRGWKPALDRYKRLFENPGAMGQLSFTTLEIHVACPNSAYVVGEYKLLRSTGAFSGVFTLQFRKFSEGWLIVVDHTTGYPNKAQTRPANP